MPQTVYNFSAGPAMLPSEVLEAAREEMLSFRGIGMSVMEISHRSRHFERVIEEARSAIKRLLSVPDTHQVLFLQGGASFQFSMVPINFLQQGAVADYIITGEWGAKALSEAKRCGSVNVVWSGEDQGFRDVPAPEQVHASSDASYLHYTSNETIGGVQFKDELDGGGVPVVCDASSDILSRPIDVKKYSLIYAGAQKNIGPSGVTVVIISDEMISRVPPNQHSTLDYRLIAKNGSMLNTPNTWGIYLVSLVGRWLEEKGGVEAIQRLNAEKARTLYEVIDQSGGFYAGHAAVDARSTMNVTFRLPSAELESMFCEEAEKRGFNGLKGHRSLGGIRASLYNAFPIAGVHALIEFMQEFSRTKG
jgi:phosphoserine aminotransferase